MVALKGYRGYVFSRPFFGHRIPQHIQNTVIREYCKRNEIYFLMSVTEYTMESSHLMLNKVVRQIADIDGLVFYSIFQLPYKNTDRRRIVSQILDASRTMHFASEKLILNNEEDAAQIELMLEVEKCLPSCPSVEDMAYLLSNSGTNISDRGPN